MSAELYHYNHNHDPRNGQFTTSSGGGSSRGSSKSRKTSGSSSNPVLTKLADRYRDYKKKKKILDEQKKKEQEQKKKNEKAKILEKEQAIKKAEEERVKQLKTNAVNDGDVAKILENKELFTTEELTKANERARAIADLKRSKDEQMLSKVRTAVNVLGTFKNLASTGYELYSTANKLKSAYYTEKEKAQKKGTKEEENYKLSQKLAKEALKKYGKTELTKENYEEIRDSLEQARVISNKIENLEELAYGKKKKQQNNGNNGNNNNK